MGILQFFKQWMGLSYGEPIPFNESNVDCFSHHFKDGFLLLSTPRYIISWDMTYQALLDTKFGYVDKDVFYFYDDMIFMGIVLKSVNVPLKIYGHTYRQDIPIRHYEMTINDTQFNELLQKTGMFLRYASNKSVVDKINYHIDFFGISIKRHNNNHDRFIVKNYRTYAYLTDVGDYENNLCLDRIIFVNHKFNIFTLNDPYHLIYLAYNSDFCPYIKNIPKPILLLIDQPNNVCQNIIWRDKNNYIGISDNHQSIIISIDDIKEFWVKTDGYELARYQDISYFCLMFTTKENKNHQIFQHSQKEVVDDICGVLNYLMV